MVRMGTLQRPHDTHQRVRGDDGGGQRVGSSTRGQEAVDRSIDLIQRKPRGQLNRR